MKITTEIVSKLNPCKDRFNNFTDKYPNYNGNLQDFIALENITYNDKVWVVTRLFTKEQNVKWSILCASKVLSIFENKYPNDKRPRLALEAAETYLYDPSEENRVAASDAAYAAADAYSAASDASDAAYAAYSAYSAAAAYAAYAAAYAAADAYAAYAAADAAYAAYADANAAYAAAYAAADAYAAYAAANAANAAYAAANAANAAYAAAYAAANAAYAAESRDTEEMVNLILMLECI